MEDEQGLEGWQLDYAIGSAIGPCGTPFPGNRSMMYCDSGDWRILPSGEWDLVSPRPFTDDANFMLVAIEWARGFGANLTIHVDPESEDSYCVEFELGAIYYQGEASSMPLAVARALYQAIKGCPKFFEDNGKD